MRRGRRPPPLCEAPRPAPHRTGLSMVEIAGALVISLLLASLTIRSYQGIQARAAENATLADLATIARAVETWQLTNRQTYPYHTLPRGLGGRRTDSWGGAYRVDPQRTTVRSMGPDGQDQAGGGDDLEVEYANWEAAR